MKKAVILLTLPIIVTTVLFCLVGCKSTSTVEDKEKNFAVADTASIVKIFIADKGDQEILLERTSESYWTVNDSYKARPGSMQILLETIKRIRAQYPVARAAHNNVIKNLASEAKKVEIYVKDNEEPFIFPDGLF